jgi:hypothetical protein
MLDRNDRGHGSVGLTESFASGETRSFEVVGLASDETTRTGMKDDILLLSWLAILLKTREGGQISFEWAYGISGESSRLSMNEVVKGLKDHILNASAAIRQYIASQSAPVASDKAPVITSPVPLILSTNSFSKKSEDTKEEVSEVLIPAKLPGFD